MSKSPDAFRTISEVADWLETPAHVLRFWESKFTQVKPVKRAGGRRYYRPADMELIGGIKRLLHDDGMTIKGVQKILRESGVKHVASLSQPLDNEAEDSGVVEASSEKDVIQSPEVIEAEQVSEAPAVVPFKPVAVEETEEAPKSSLDLSEEPVISPPTDSVPSPVDQEDDVAEIEPTPEHVAEPDASLVDTVDDDETPDVQALSDDSDDTEDEGVATEQVDETKDEKLPEPDGHDDESELAANDEKEGEAPAAVLPSFLKPPTKPAEDAVATDTDDTNATEDTQTESDTSEPDEIVPDVAQKESPEESKTPAIVAPDVPDDPDPDTITAANGPLLHLSRIKALSPAQAEEISPLLDRLREMRQSRGTSSRP